MEDVLMNINTKKVLSLSLVSMLSVSSAVQAAWPSFLQFSKNETAQEVAPVETTDTSNETSVLPFEADPRILLKRVMESAAVATIGGAIVKNIPSKQACLQFMNSMPGRAKIAATGLVAGAKFAYHNPLLAVQTHPYAAAATAAAVGGYGAYKGYQWFTRTPEKLLNEAEDALSDETVLLVSDTNTLDNIKETLNNSLTKVEQALLLVAKKQASDANRQQQSDVSGRINNLREQITTAGSDEVLELISGFITDIIDEVRAISKETTSVPVLQQAKTTLLNHKWKTLGALSVAGLAATLATHPEWVTNAPALATTAYSAAKNYDYRGFYNSYCNRQALANGFAKATGALSSCYARTRDAVGNSWAQAVDWAKGNPRAVAVAAVSVPTTTGAGVAIKARNTENSRKSEVAQAVNELEEVIAGMSDSEDIMETQAEIDEKIDTISGVVDRCNYRWAVRIRELIRNVPGNFINQDKQRNLKGMINDLAANFRSSFQQHWRWGFQQVSRCIGSIRAAVTPR